MNVSDDDILCPCIPLPEKPVTSRQKRMNMILNEMIIGEPYRPTHFQKMLKTQNEQSLYRMLVELEHRGLIEKTINKGGLHFFVRLK